MSDLQIFTMQETAKILSIGLTKLYEEISSGRLKAVKVGKRTLVPQANIEEWQDNLPAYRPWKANKADS